MESGLSQEEMSIRPVGEYVLIQKLPGQKVMEQGGILIPDFGNLRDKGHAVCKVLAVGGKVKELKKGMKLYVESYGSHLAGTEFTDSVTGEVFTLMREKHVNLVAV